MRDFHQLTFLAKKWSWNLINVGLNPLKQKTQISQIPAEYLKQQPEWWMVHLPWWFYEDYKMIPFETTHYWLQIVFLLGEVGRSQGKYQSTPKLKCHLYIHLRGRTAAITGPFWAHKNVCVRISCAWSNLYFGITILPQEFKIIFQLQPYQ